MHNLRSKQAYGRASTLYWLEEGAANIGALRLLLLQKDAHLARSAFSRFLKQEHGGYSLSDRVFTIVTLIVDGLDHRESKFGMHRKTLVSCASLLLAMLLFANCGQDRTPASNDNSSKAQVGTSPTTTPGSDTASPTVTSSASIVASPNPVSAGKGFGTTTITWDTGDGTVGQVYLSEGVNAEKLFAERPKGSQEAPWIGVGTTYEFRLYKGKEHKQLLASVKVTRNEK